MKKHLLATSALVAAGALAVHSASAQTKPIELTVGGYMEQWVGYANSDTQFTTQDNVSDVDVQADGEIHFDGSTTLDNGLTFGVNVQLEAETTADQIDEAYLFVRGQFGELLLGSENGAAYAMHYGLSSMGLGLDLGDLSNWIVGTNFALHTTYNYARRDNDSNKIRWISPRFAGVQIGASWAPEATQDEDGFNGIGFPEEVSGIPGSDNNTSRHEEGVATAAINYDNKFGTTRIRASVGGQYVTDSNQNGDEPWSASTGLRVGFGAFEVGGAYIFENNVEPNYASRQVAGAFVTWEDGPVGVSLDVTYGMGRTFARDDNQLGVELGGKYVLAPGVEARGSLYYADRDQDGPVPASQPLGPNSGDTTGFAAVGGIRLVF